jgi:hypothetical protein
LSYIDGLENVTSPTTSYTNTTNSSPRDSASGTAVIVSSVLGIVIVVTILLILWYRRRTGSEGKPKYMLAQQRDILDKDAIQLIPQLFRRKASESY